MPYTLKEVKDNEAWTSMNDADAREYELLLQEAITNLNISGSGDPNVAPTLRDENGVVLSFEDRNTGDALDHPNQQRQGEDSRHKTSSHLQMLDWDCCGDAEVLF